MAQCKNCGAQVESGSKFCQSCGTAVETQTTDFSQKLSDLNNTADTTVDFDPQDISKNKVMAIFAYIGILVLVPIFGAKESKFARFHANQGLVLIVASLIWGVIAAILGAIPVVDIIIGIVSWVVSIIFLVLCIIGILNAANGKAKELPIIGKYKLLK